MTLSDTAAVLFGAIVGSRDTQVTAQSTATSGRLAGGGAHSTTIVSH